MYNKEITEQIEQLSMDFVLVDTTDLQDLAGIQKYFDKICDLSKESGWNDVSQNSLKASELISKIINQTIANNDTSISKISDLISIMQKQIRNHINSENGSDEPDECQPINKPQTKESIPSNTDKKISKESKPKEKVKAGLRHPSSLPDHLDEALFAEFLGMQPRVLEKMEELILQAEQVDNKQILLELKRIFHTMKGEAGFLNLDDIEKLCHKIEDILINEKAEKFIDLFLSVKDWLSTAFEYYAGSGAQPDPVDKWLNQIERINSLEQQNSNIPTEDKIDCKTKLTDQSQESENQQNTKKYSDRAPKAQNIKQSINIDAERLDRIIDMIGELVIAESMVFQADEIQTISSPQFHRHLNQLDKITRGLQEVGLSLRMLPIKSTFNKMGRIVRDISKKSGKKVLFSTSGEETELDKSVVDKIGDPLMHMIRNAVDHGIEDNVQERINAGKPEEGKIQIRAFHKGGNIYIEIEDDGRGLDRNTIIAKANERGLIYDWPSMSDREVFNIIFESGFSTAKKVTDISGRGVGMDVVKDSITSLHGSVKIFSQTGKGSIFSIRIPLTLAIIDGMVVKIKQERYIIPTLSIVLLTTLLKQNITNLMNKASTIRIQNKIVPLYDLAHLFHPDTYIEHKDLNNSIEKIPIVVVENNGKWAALIIDEIIGKQQIVIKNLGETMRNIPGISGAAIMPDGRVGLIIDVGGVVTLATEKN